MTTFEELPAIIAEVAGRIGPAVVAIGAGAGFVITDGVILTNAHNLRGPGPTVRFADGRRAAGGITGVDLEGDLAVVTVDTADTTPLNWADRPELSVGAPVLAVGVGHRGTRRVTLGLVSSADQSFRGPRGRRIADAVEHTAPLARGSSGGPLLDLEGRLVGLNTHRHEEGFYLAQPTSTRLRARIDALTRGESPKPVRLGIAVAPGRVARRMRVAVGLSQRDGLLVREVEPDSPADRAGITGGDLIVAVAGEPVTGSDALFATLDAHDPATPLSLVVVRGEQERTVEVLFDSSAQERGEP